MLAGLSRIRWGRGAEAKATAPSVGGLAAAVLPVAAMGSAAAGNDAELLELGR
jgi:hypothetical protein